jgi:LuxR family transcriptional regulator, maltose regulon positive regulatory protein
MPKPSIHALIWSEESHRYELSTRGHPEQWFVPENEEPWLRWLDTQTSFSFQGQRGRMTVIKEARPRGAGYWYAYHYSGQRSVKRYLGRTGHVTIARLEEIAEALAASIGSSIDERSRAKGAVVPELHVVSPGEEMRAVLQEPVPGPMPASRSEQGGPLLVPKILPPRLHASLVTRPRLLARLDAGLDGKLTMLSAPAGFGKTTLVSQWIADRSTHQSDQHSLPPVAWVSLDPSDNDPVRFWRYVMTACQAWQASPGQSALRLLHTAPQSPLEVVLTLFLNELSQLPRKGILVLEDYHVITTSQIHETLTFVLDHLPATLHLMIITRVDPPLPLPRWRAHNDLCELHTEDLRFSPEETQPFLQQTMPFPLSSGVIMHLDTHLEGWVAGLRLVALTLQGRMTQQELELEQVLASFSGNHRHLLEYFVTEVLDAQPEPLQVFLLHTSVLHRLTGSLCDMVTGRNDSEQLLEAMERAGLFLIPLEGGDRWYRYHTLFAEAMQYEARRRLGDEAVRSCLSRASVWYEHHGLLTEAVEAALEAQAFARAAALLEQIIKPHYAQEVYEYHTIPRWLDGFPEAILGQHPRLCLRLAMLVLFFSDRGAPASPIPIERLLSLAERAFQVADNYSGLGEVCAARALLAKLQDDVALAARLARQALAWLPEGEQQWRATCLRCLGEEERLSGRLHEARQMSLEAQALFVASGNGFATRATLLTLGEVCFLQGELHQAAALYRAALAAAGEDLADTGQALLGRTQLRVGGKPITICFTTNAGQALLGLARLSYEWNDLAAAEQEAREAVDLGTRFADESLQVHASLVLADIQQARGQTAQAQHLLQVLLAQMPPRHPPLLHREIRVAQARLQLAARDLTAVEHWSITSAMYRESIPLLLQEQEELMVARLFMAQEKASALRPAEPERSHARGMAGRKSKGDEALHLLARRQVEARQQGRTRSDVEMLILMALLHFAHQRQSHAWQRLREALALAHAEGYQRLFLDEGEPMMALLRAVLPMIGKEPPDTYVRTLLRAFAQQQLEQFAPAAAGSPGSARLIEPLSPQEERVLRLLVAGFSNPEIAEAMVVSNNTVKTQVQSIYRKLGVSSRKEAREAVRGQHLL